MNKWIKKSFVAIVTILTFGLVTPFQTITAANDQLNKPDNDEFLESKQSDSKQLVNYKLVEGYQSEKERFLSETIQGGYEQAWKKFGERIGPIIEDEFQQVILPNIERVITDVAGQFTEEELKNLTISETPGKGTSEKIFHIYNETTGKDIIRFHVRRDLRPQEGYWFNFHYHTYHDNFQSHHLLGEIYWDKNTPPNWAN